MEGCYKAVFVPTERFSRGGGSSGSSGRRPEGVWYRPYGAKSGHESGHDGLGRRGEIPGYGKGILFIRAKLG